MKSYNQSKKLSMARSGSYYLCLMQDSTYQIRSKPRARDGVFVAYGPWKYDKCEWWLRLIKDYIKRGEGLDLSRLEAKRFEKNRLGEKGDKSVCTLY